MLFCVSKATIKYKSSSNEQNLKGLREIEKSSREMVLKPDCTVESLGGDFKEC